MWEGTYSKYAMIGVWVSAAIASVAAIFLGFYLGRTAPWAVILGGNLLVWLAIVGRYFYMRLSRHYTLTSQRFTHRHGLLWRQTDRIEVIDIDDVAFTQGPVERMFGIGTIRVTSSDQSHPKLMLHGIENVQAVASVIDEARRKERRKRGLYIESV